MKSILFPNVLKTFFAVLEGIVLLGTIVALTLVWLVPHLSRNAWYSIGPIEFVQPGLSFPLSIANTGDFEVQNLQGTVKITNDAARLGTIRWAIFALLTLHGLFFFALFDLLRRLFRNVGRRESFSAQNIRLVRRVGLAIILFTFLSAATQSLFGYCAIKYLGNSATLMGAEVRLAPAASRKAAFKVQATEFQFSLDFTGILAGLVVIALSEVFRQGRQLQEENQLTI